MLEKCGSEEDLCALRENIGSVAPQNNPIVEQPAICNRPEIVMPK